MTEHPSRALIIQVRFSSGRYHGFPEWPPSPARLFQALVSGAGPLLSEDVERSLRWLEWLDPPLVQAPSHWKGREYKLFVPNNDLDAIGGDPHRVAEIRTIKRVRPVIFDERIPLIYGWTFPQTEDGEVQARIVRSVAERLYQLGRGVDMAFAHAEVCPVDAIEMVLAAHPGTLYRPTAGARSGRGFHCPVPGSLESLKRRFEAATARFRVATRGRNTIQVFTQPPKPLFAEVRYDSPPVRELFELHPEDDMEARSAWSLVKAVHLVERVRDAAVNRLNRGFPDRAGQATAFLVGRRPGEPGAPPEQRVRLVPVPSIGHEHVDRGIRRFLVEVPATCPIEVEDVFWAFSGVKIALTESDPAIVLVRSADWRMLDYYGVGTRSRCWRTVTPAVLPEYAKRRRMEPARRREEAKAGQERADEEARAAFAVTQALRHAGVNVPVQMIRAQREPFEGRGERAEAFAPGTRFPKERLWHVQLTFAERVSGPLIIGDGRFLGLGLMHPWRQQEEAFAFAIEDGLVPGADPAEIGNAMRRAVMARVQEVLDPRAPLPTYFSGHLRNGAPADAATPHLSFAFDPAVPRLLIIPPHLRGRQTLGPDHRKHITTLEEALVGLRELRAGAAGRLILRQVPVDLAHDPLFAASVRWKSLTPYLVNRHTKGVGASEALRVDLRASCRQQKLPDPDVAVEEAQGVPGIGLVGRAVLTFPVAVPGPLLLGRNRHKGGGLFTSVHL